MCAASGRQPSRLCQAHVALASWDPKVSTHWSPRSAETSSLSRMLRALPCCTGSQKGLVCLELSFSPSMFWWPSCVAAEVAFSRYSGMEPRARGGPCQETHSGTPKTTGFLLRWQQFLQSCFGTLLVWRRFSAQLYFHLGRGWKASFPLCSIRRTCPGSDACLPCGLGQVTSPFWASGASFVKLEVMTLAAVLRSTSY